MTTYKFNKTRFTKQLRETQVFALVHAGTRANCFARAMFRNDAKLYSITHPEYFTWL